jgi:hypothetical protein
MAHNNTVLGNMLQFLPRHVLEHQVETHSWQGPKQANVTAYLVSVAAYMIGEGLDLGKIWQQQDLSPKLKQQLQTWASEVHDILHNSATGRIVSEWAKKKECWDIVRRANYSNPIDGIPELAVVRV